MTVKGERIPAPSVPTTVPVELIPRAIMVVDPLMFTSLAFVVAVGLAVKFVMVFPSLARVNPTTVVEFAMPFIMVPVPAALPAFGPSKFVN